MTIRLYMYTNWQSSRYFVFILSVWKERPARLPLSRLYQCWSIINFKKLYLIGSWRVVGSLKACLRHCMMYLSILYRFCIIKVNFIENSFFIAIAEDQKNQHNFIIKKKDFIEMNEWKCISQSTQTVKNHLYTCIDETIIMVEWWK